MQSPTSRSETLVRAGNASTGSSDAGDTTEPDVKEDTVEPDVEEDTVEPDVEEDTIEPNEDVPEPEVEEDAPEPDVIEVITDTIEDVPDTGSDAGDNTRTSLSAGAGAATAAYCVLVAACTVEFPPGCEERVEEYLVDEFDAECLEDYVALLDGARGIERIEAYLDIYEGRETEVRAATEACWRA